MSEKAVAPSDYVDVPLLKFESNWMGVLYVWPITTIQFYEGDPNAAATYLKNRLLEVARANPWIGSKIVKDKKKHGNLLAMRYSVNNPPIDEIFEVKKQVMNHLKDQRGNSIYQLERFYPEIFDKLKKKGLAFMIKSLGETLSNGIEFGLIRKNIDVDFVSRIYYNSILGLMDPEIYPPKNYSLDKTMFDYREYFLRSVVTEKGLKKLDEILINDK